MRHLVRKDPVIKFHLRTPTVLHNVCKIDHHTVNLTPIIMRIHNNADKGFRPAVNVLTVSTRVNEVMIFVKFVTINDGNYKRVSGFVTVIGLKREIKWYRVRPGESYRLIRRKRNWKRLSMTKQTL